MNSMAPPFCLKKSNKITYFIMPVTYFFLNSNN